MLHVKDGHQKFRQGDFSLKDESRAGRPEKIETDELHASTAGYKLYANWKGACRTAWHYAASHFRTITYDGKGSEEFEFYKKSSELFCTPNIFNITDSDSRLMKWRLKRVWLWNHIYDRHGNTNADVLNRYPIQTKRSTNFVIMKIKGKKKTTKITKKRRRK